MAATVYSRRLRLAVIGCVLLGVLTIHVAVRYLHGTLFGFVTYRGLAPIVPWLVLGVYALCLAVGALFAVIRRGARGIVPGTGLSSLAVEPITSMLLHGDGCEVGRGVAGSLVPEIAVEGYGAVALLWTWNGACSVSVTTPLVGLGLLGCAGGLWMGDVPERTLSRWTALLERSVPSDGSDSPKL